MTATRKPFNAHAARLSARDALASSTNYSEDERGVRDLLCDLLHLAEYFDLDVNMEVRAALHEYNRERAQ